MKTKLRSIRNLSALLALVTLLLCPGLGWGQLLQWNTFGNAGTETTEPSVANNANITASSLTQGSITAATNANRFGGSGWFNTGNTVAGNTLAEAIAGNDYIQFIVTPNSGYSFSPTSFYFSWQSSSTGPKTVTLRSSADSYTTDLGTTAVTATIATYTLTISGLSNITTATTFRLYGYGATATTGTGGFDVATNVVDVQLNGTTSATGGSAPTVTTQAVSSIGTTTATGNGNITATGGVDPTARGFCWDLATNADPDISDSKVEETGTFSTGAFTGSITGLTAGTQYKVRAYATNTTGTGYGSVVTFYTQSTEPTAHAASFTATAASQTQIDLTFSAASTIPASGYLIIQRTSAAPTGTPADATGYTVGNTIGDGTVAAIVTNTAATSASISGLTAGTHYYYTIFPYNWDGASSSTYNYRTSATVPGADATTDAANDLTTEVDGPVLAGQPNPVLISSLSDTDAEAIRVFDMDVYDFGPDVLNTNITQLTINSGLSDNADWTQVIQGVKLSIDGGSTFVTLGTPVINAESIVIPVASGNLVVPDNDAITISLYIYLKTTVADNKTLQFAVAQSGHGFTADATGTDFAATFTNLTVSNTMLVDVDATLLAFVQQPTTTGTNVSMSPAVTIQAVDANNNRDLDASDLITIVSTGTLTASQTVSLSSGLATFSSIVHSAEGTGLQLTASATGFSGVSSSLFDIVLLPLPGEIIINQFSPDYNGSSNEYVELLNKTDKTFDLSRLRISYQSAAGANGGAGGVLSGSIGPYQYWLLSPDATITVGQTSSLSRDGNLTAGFAAASGQLALRLVNAPNTIIDGLAYGTITLNNLGEGTAAVSPPADGGLIRVVDGADNNANSTDYTTVAQANIYLRNHNSINVTGDYTLPSTSYSADVVLSNTSSLSLSGNTSISGKLTILSGSMTIAADQGLTVNGTVTNIVGEGGIYIESNASGSGSLIHNTAGVSGTVERYVPAANWSTGTDGWHLLSSPVAAQSIGDEWTPAGTGNDYDMYIFDETKINEYWLNQKVPANNINTFETGKGYLVAYEQAGTKLFLGNLNNIDVTLSGLSNSGAASAYPGWHLVGNPFASALDYDLGTWTKTNIDAEMQVWDEVASSYKTSTEVSGIIPSMNGFMIHTSGSGILTIPADARTYNTANWYKSDEEYILLKANDLETSMSQSSIVRFNSLSTDAYDSDFDSYFLQGFAPAFYSVTGGNLYALNTLPEVTGSMVIPFGFSKNGSSEFSIELSKSITGTSVFLTDKKTSIVTNLTETPVYNFSATEGDDANRFTIHFSSVGIDDINSSSGVRVYTSGSNINVSLQQNSNAVVKVYSLTGQLVLQGNTGGKLLTTINAGEQHDGIYIVSIISGEQTISRKIVLKK